MAAQRMQQRRIGIDRTDGFDLLGKGLRLSLLGFGVEPVTTTMRLQIGLILKSAPPSGAKWGGQSGV
jgi:hypothetical protein